MSDMQLTEMCLQLLNGWNRVLRKKENSSEIPVDGERVEATRAQCVQQSEMDGSL